MMKALKVPARKQLEQRNSGGTDISFRFKSKTNGSNEDPSLKHVDYYQNASPWTCVSIDRFSSAQL